MFEAMMGQIEDDFVRYVFHLQVVVDEEPRQDLRNVSYSAPTDPVQGSGRDRGRDGGRARSSTGLSRARSPTTADGRCHRRRAEVAQQPVRVEKTPGRNEPCFCGSGKKYKLCHGR